MKNRARQVLLKKKHQRNLTRYFHVRGAIAWTLNSATTTTTTSTSLVISARTVRDTGLQEEQ